MGNAAAGGQKASFPDYSAMRYSVNIPEAGSYRVRYLARPTSSSSDQIDIYAYDGQGWLSSPACAATGGQRWCDGPVIGPLQPGNRTLWLGTIATIGTYELDAFVLEKLP